MPFLCFLHISCPAGSLRALLFTGWLALNNRNRQRKLNYLHVYLLSALSCMNAGVSSMFLQHVGVILVTTACLGNVGQLVWAVHTAALLLVRRTGVTLMRPQIALTFFRLIALTSEALCFTSPVTCCSSKINSWGVTWGGDEWWEKSTRVMRRMHTGRWGRETNENVAVFSDLEAVFRMTDMCGRTGDWLNKASSVKTALRRRGNDIFPGSSSPAFLINWRLSQLITRSWKHSLDFQILHLYSNKWSNS